MAHIERGGIRTLVEELDTKVNAILLGGAFYDVSTAESAITDEVKDWGVRLYSAGGEPVEEANITTPGSWKVYRIRDQVTTQIVPGAFLSAGPGRVFTIYGFPTAEWDIGDLFYFVMTGTEYLEGAITKQVPTRLIWGRVVLEHSVEEVHTKVVDLDADLALVAQSIATLQGTANAIKLQTDKLVFSTDRVKATLANEQVGLIEGAISASKIMSNAIDSGKVADGFITANKIAANAITDAKIASNAITWQKIAAGAILAGHLAPGAIDSSKLAANTINASKINPDAVTKIQEGLPLLRQIPGNNMVRAIGSCESLEGWGTWGSGPIELSTEQVYGGTYSIKKSNLASGDGISSPVDGPLVAGVTYRVRAKVWNVNAGSTLTVGMYNGRFEEHPATWARTQLAAGSVWTTVDALFTPLTTYTGATVVFRMSGTSGNWHLDEVSVTASDPNDLLIPATPRAGSLLDILHKDTSGTYSRATDSLEAIRDRLDESLGTGFDAATDALRFATDGSRSAKWLLRNQNQYRTRKLLQWAISNTNSFITAPAVDSAADDIDGGSGPFSGTVKWPIKPETISIVAGALGGSMSSFSFIAQVYDNTNTWRNITGWSSGVTQLTSNGIYVIQPPNLIVDGVYVKDLRYSFVVVGSSLTGNIHISTSWLHHLEIA